MTIPWNIAPASAVLRGVCWMLYDSPPLKSSFEDAFSFDGNDEYEFDNECELSSLRGLQLI